jgi:hypothetical protein
VIALKGLTLLSSVVTMDSGEDAGGS